MYYVVLEVETAYNEECPRDQGRITKFHYQFFDAETLKPVFEENKHVILEPNQPLQDGITTLNQDISEKTDGEFVICSLNSTWQFRVTIPRQARDEVFILPPHLQHPKVFDLWKEYYRWCVNHPEIIALKKSDAIGTKLKDIAELKRILELDTNDGETDTLSLSIDVLLQLHKKCVSAEDKSMVLTHPYDSYLDVRHFLQERSKVLYMNNLPPDTTQSELESWFTQFGARPVGFWTVKNIVEETSNVNNNWSSNNSTYVEMQDSISGFVVFQSHEEATEALSLNGRSILSNVANTKQPRVIEHVVEIQPSSARVLDRAHEILSPFPQSKNKPRPGDWNCPSCGFSNFQRRTACFRCSFPATSAVAVNKNAYIKNPSQASLTGQAQQQAYKPRVQNALQQPSLQPQTLHQQQQQQQRMRYTQGQRFPQNQQQGGSNVPFRAGDWKCATCTYHNFAKNVVCLRCGGPKNTEPQQKELGATNSFSDIQEANNGMGISLDARSFSEPAWSGTHV